MTLYKIQDWIDNYNIDKTDNEINMEKDLDLLFGEKEIEEKINEDKTNVHVL